jgi:SAM-dependent methyltransferase
MGTARSLRALGRRALALKSRSKAAGLAADRYDSWLQHFHAESLGAIDAACEGGGPECFALFRDLDVDLWALLLTQEYEIYPNIRSLLPSVPDPSLQELWTGTSGVALASQSAAFYRKLCERFRRHGDRPLADARVLDFGCGWGRLTRFLPRDVKPGRLYGCDPVQWILDVCRQCRVPATLVRSDFLPERLPFSEPFDLVFAFSVFTHLSEAAHEWSLRALHGAMAPGAILVVTVRPPDYLRLSPLMRPALESLSSDRRLSIDEPRHFFVPHPAEDSHPQYEADEMTYGEAVITLPYISERWSSMFELLGVELIIGDLHQVMLTLRRR